MNFTNNREHAAPARWVPTLYFAEGLPFYTVGLIALIFYQRMGVRNEVIALATSLLAIPWSLKPLWSPFLEMYKTKKFFVVCFEVLGGVSLGLLALALPWAGYLRYSIAFFAILAFCSASHDIVADGLYIASLEPRQQSAFAGWQGGFYNVARFFAQGGLIILAGYLENRIPVVRAWMTIFAGIGLMLVVLGLYHARVLPKEAERRHTQNLRDAIRTYGDVVVSFFRKPNILLLLIFIFLYRAGEGQLVKIGPLFLKSLRARWRARLDHSAIWDDLWNLRNGGVHCRYGSGRIFHVVAGAEARDFAAHHHHELAERGIRLSQHGSSGKHSGCRRSLVRGNVRIRLWICWRDSAHDAGDCSRQLPGRALCIRKFADESGAGDPRSHQRIRTEMDGLPDVLCLGVDFRDSGACDGKVCSNRTFKGRRNATVAGIC